MRALLRFVPLLLYAAAGAYSIVAFWQYPRWTVDDAYIAFRYAKHLAFHGQLAWNLGSRPVEGYTGLALPVLVAGGMRAGLAPQGLTRIVGIGSYYVAAWTLSDNQRKLGVPEPTRAFVTAALMMLPALFAHATSGLETMAFAATLGLCFGRLLSCEASPRLSNQVRLWVVLLLLSLIRPEGALFAAAFGAALFARVWLSSRRLAPSIALAGLYVVPYGGYFAWRLAYYGRLFPNTYYAKAAEGTFDSEFARGALSLGNALLPLIVAGSAVALLAPERRALPRTPILAALLSVVALAVAYSRSTLIMGYLYRFQIHCFFLVAPLLGVLLSAQPWPELTRRFGYARGGMLAALLAVCLVAGPSEWIRVQSEAATDARTYLEVMTEEHARVGAWLRDRLPASEAVGCWVDAGVIPFLADNHVYIDFGRLNDRYLAQPGMTRAKVADYYFSVRPGAIVVTPDTAHFVGSQFDAAILTEDPRFGEYERKETFCSKTHPGAPCEILYVRRGVAPE
jgi:hypothetical protein